VRETSTSTHSYPAFNAAANAGTVLGNGRTLGVSAGQSLEPTVPCAHTSGSVGRAQKAFVGPMARASAGVPLSCAGVSGARFECADDDDVGASEGEGGDRSALISADISMSVTKRDPPRRIATFWTVAGVEWGTDGTKSQRRRLGRVGTARRLAMDLR